MKIKFNLKTSILFSLFMIVSIIGSTAGVRYYVSTTGNNANNGQNASPFLTITQAVNTATNGDTIVVQPGTYRETIDMLGKNLILTSTYMFTKDTNIIANTKLNFQDAGVNGGLYESVYNYNFKQLYGFTVYNSPKIAIGNIHNITIEKCVFRNNGYGDATNNILIFLYARDAGNFSKMIDCDIYNNNNNTLILNNDRNSVGHSSEVRNTKIHHNSLGSALDGTAISLGDGPIDIINTLIYKNKFGYAINHVGNPNYGTVKINFTTIANNIGKGVLIYPNSGTFRIVYSNSIIANNTGLPFTVNHTGANVYAGSIINWRNNIITGGYSGLSINNPQLGINPSYIDLTFKNNFDASPIFVDSVNGDYKLASGSIGTAMGAYNNANYVDTIKTDFNGLSRPISTTNGPDIGAVQNQASVLSITAPVAFTLTKNAINRFKLSWSSSSSYNTKSFNIYKSTGGGSYSLLATTSNTNYMDNNIVSGTSYSYKVTETIKPNTNTSALDTGLTNFFTFNGNANDANNAQVQGSVNSATIAADRFSNSSAAYSFNGSSSYIEYSDTIANVTSTSPYTLSFWAKELVSGGQILGKYLNQDASKSQFAVATSRMMGNGSDYYDHTVSPDNLWNHYGVILESGSGKTKVYKNGNLVSPAGTITYNTSTTTTKFILGKLSGSPAGPFNGLIDDIRIFKGVVAEAKLKNIYSYESQYGYVATESGYSNIGTLTASITAGKIYVDQATGSANNEGNSASPLATINQAIATAINGDTIVVLPGTYRETIDLLGKNLVITSNYMFTKDTTIIANTKINLQDAGANGGIYSIIDNYNAKKIYGITLYNSPHVVINSMRNITIEKCVLKENGYGVSPNPPNGDFPAGRNFLISIIGTNSTSNYSMVKDCDIYSNSNNTLIWNADRNSLGTPALITNTKIHHNSLGTSLDGTAIYVYGPIDITNTLIYKNKFGHGVYYGANPNYALVKLNFVTIANNIGNAVISNPLSGTNTAVITNSIFTDNTGYNFKVQYSGSLGNIYDGLRIQWRNNVIQGGFANMVILNPDLVSPNAPYRTKAYVELTYLNNFEGRPIFIDSANADYRLAAGSLGLAMGNFNASLNVDSVKTDILGITRPTSASQGPDIGAIQTSTISAALPTPTLLTASQGIKGRVILNWTSSSGLPNKLFNIYRSSDAGATYSQIGGTISTTYTDTNVVKNIPYSYKVTEVKNNYANINSLDTGLSSLMTYDKAAYDVLNPEKYVNVVGAYTSNDRFNNRNSAYNFSGSNQYIEYSSDMANLDQSNPKTISLWAKSSSSPGMGMSANYMSKNNGYDLASPFVGSSVKQFTLGTTSITGDGSNTLSYTNNGTNWNHYVFVLQSGTNNTKIYRNDTLLTTGTVTYLTNAGVNNSKVIVGKTSQYPTGEFSGLIDDIRVYNRALSSSEINNIYSYESQYGNISNESAYSTATQITVTGKKFYVDKSTGSNTNLGSSISPFASLQYAIDNASDNDTVILSDHSYDEILTIPISTSITIASKYILDGDSTHINTCSIDGTNNTFTDIQISANSNISFIGLTLKKVKGKLVYLPNNDIKLTRVKITELGYNSSNVLSNSIVARKVTVDSSTIYKNKYVEGIFNISDSLTFTNSKFYNNEGGLLSNNNSSNMSSVYISKSLFVDNTRTQGMSSFGNYMTINAQRYSVYQSKFINNSYTVFGGSGAGYSKFINNLFLNNTKNIERNPQVTMNDSVILIHNSFIQNANPTSAANSNAYTMYTPSPAAGSVAGFYPWSDMSFFPAGNWKGLFYNNIFYGNMDFSGPQNNNNQVGIFLKMKGNLFKNFPTFTGVDTSGSQNNKLFTNLTFIDTANYNFQFVDTSSYLGSGSIITYPFTGDINGDPRPAASVAPPEPGAFESPYSFSPPTGLTASIGNKKIYLSWLNANSVAGTTYKIYRSNASIPQYSAPTELGVSATTTYKDSASGLNYLSNQYYRVRTVSSAGGYSGFSNEVSILPDSVPTPVIINDSSVAGIASFKWTQGLSSNISKYYIYRSDDMLNYVKMDSSTTIKRVTSTLPVADKLYYFKMTAVDRLGIESDLSENIIQVGYAKPELVSPENTSAKLDSATTLRWRKMNNATKYKIQYATDNAFSIDLTEKTVTDTFTVISGLKLGKVYSWRVMAMDTSHKSDWSGAYTFKTLITKPTLNSITVNNKKLTVNWTTTDTANTKWFKLFKDTIPNPSKLLDSFSNKVFKYEDSVKNNIKYYYRLTAVGLTNLESDFSNVLNATAINTKPIATRFADKTIDSIGQNSYLKLRYSASSSSDADGTIVGYKWLVNDSVINTKDSVITYNFLIGNNKLKLIVTDNDDASDTSVSNIKISSVVKQFAAGFLGGITAVGPNIIYTADTSYDQITGASIYKLDSKGEVNYPLSVTSKIFTTPSVSNDSSVFITSGSNINGFGKTGAPLWSTIPLGGISYVTPTVDSLFNIIYLGVSNKNFFAIDYKTGKIAWNLIGDAPINSSAVITGSRKLVFTSELGTLYGFDISTNKAQTAAKWKSSLGEIITRSPAIDNKYHLYFGSDGGNVLKIALNDDGTVTKLWSKSLGSAIKTSPVIDAEGAIYVGNDNGDLVKLDSATGNIIWTYPTGGAIKSTPSISEYGTIYVANMNGSIYAIKTDKSLRWKYQTDAPISSNLLYINSAIYVGSEGGKLISLYDNVITNTVNTSLVATITDKIKSNSNDLGNLIKSNVVDSSALVKKDPIWGTFQGNYKRNGAQALECPAFPVFNIPDCINKGDSILVTTANLSNKNWVINDSIYTKIVDTVIKVKATDKIKIRATNSYGCVVNSSNTGLIPGSAAAVPTITSSNAKNSFCEGDSIKLSTPVTANSYSWSNGSSTLSSANSLSVKQSGSFSISITNSYGCKNTSAKFDVAVTKIPDVPTLSRDINGNLVSSSLYSSVWYKDAQLITDTTKSIKPVLTGVYSVKSNNNGCLSTISSNYYFLVTDIININSTEFVKLAPNPMNNFIVINYNIQGYQKLNVDVFETSSGRIVASRPNIYSGSKLYFSELSSGTYVFRVYSSDLLKSYQFKIVKL